MNKIINPITTNVFLGFLCLMFFVWLAPGFFNEILFQGVFMKAIYIIPSLLLGIPIWIFFNRVSSRRNNLLLIFGVVLSGLIWLGIYTGTEYITYTKYGEMNKWKTMIGSDHQSIRYTASKIAGIELENSINAVTEQVDEDSVFPILTKDGLGYIAQVQPDGFIATFRQNNPGFIIFDDSSNSSAKIRRVDQELKIGSGMQLFDNLERQLYLTDWFATYDEVHILRIDQNNQEKYVIAAPKIKYSFWRFPYWAGVVLIHDDGKIEDLSVEEAQADSRLKKQWIVPSTLVRHYVELQNYAMGYINSFFRVEGKIEIPEFPGDNQFPFLIRGVFGTTYFVTAVKAEGGGTGLYRMYYVNATTFESGFYQYPKGSIVYGPYAALKRIQNLSGYNWYRRSSSGSSSGNMQAVEPVYIIKKGQLYWKFSITNMDFSGTSAVVVVDGKNLDNILEFKTRAAFDAWILGEKVKPIMETSEPLDENSAIVLIKKARKLFAQGMQLLQQAESKISK
jgi:hypothetical protein